MAWSWIKRNNEVVIWCLALGWLALGVDYHEHAKGFCAFRIIGIETLTGIDACPGCGLGRSMAAALHGAWSISWKHHWMGIPAIFIIAFRIVALIIHQPIKQQQRHGYLPDVPARSATRRSRGN